MNIMEEVLGLIKDDLEEDIYLPINMHVEKLSRNSSGTHVDLNIYLETEHGEKLLLTRSISLGKGAQGKYNYDTQRVLDRLLKSPEGVSKATLIRNLRLNTTIIDKALKDIQPAYEVSESKVMSGALSAYGRPRYESRIFVS